MNAVKSIVGATAAIAMVAGCASQEKGGPSNQTMGTILGAGAGGLIGGIAFNSAGGVIGGALVGAGTAGNHGDRRGCSNDGFDSVHLVHLRL